MALNRNKKKKIIKKIKKIAKKSLSIITANPSGVTVNEINSLRKESRQNNVNIYVIRNTLLKKSLKQTNYSKLETVLHGPTLIAFSMQHPGSASRLFQEFSKKYPTFKINNAIYEKKLLHTNEIDDLAKLPTYLESITKFILILKEISLGKLLRVLRNITQKTM